jgi:hypothetical protein
MATAQTFDDQLADLRAELADSFEILPLSEGWLLQPVDEDAGFRALELDGSVLAVDGVEISADELRARFGDLAEPILRLRELGSEEQRLVLAEEAIAQEIAEDTGAEIDEDEVVAIREEKRARKVRRERHEVNRSDAQVVVGSSVVIEEDEVARDVVVVGGSLTIHGLVKGDAVAIGGSVEIDGEVTGDVAAIGSSVELESGARVGGDAVSIGGSVEQDADAVVDGMIQEVPFFPSLRFGGWSGSGAKISHGPDFSVDMSRHWRPFDIIWGFFGVAVLAIFAALTLLIARNPVERVGRQIADEPWKSGLVGLLSQILFAPLLVILVLILVISIVGIPFLLLLPFVFIALLLIALLGYTAVALRLGQWSEERFGWNFSTPFLALLVGIGLIEIWSLVGEFLSAGPGPIKFFAVMFALFGGLLCYVVWTVGFGAAILSRVGTASSWDGGAVAPVDNNDWNVPLDPIASDVNTAAGGDDLSSFDGTGVESDSSGGWMDGDEETPPAPPEDDKG